MKGENNTMGPTRRKSNSATRPPQKRTLENGYTVDEYQEGSTIAKKGREFITAPHGTPSLMDTNVTPVTYSKPTIFSAQGRSVVTNSKPGNGSSDDFEEDEYMNKMSKEYKGQREDSGTTQTKDARREEFQASVRKTVFNRIKFVLKDSDLDFGGPFYKCMVGQLKVKEDNNVNIEEYWSVHRTLVKEALNNKRGTVNGMMKEAFMSKTKKREMNSVFDYRLTTIIQILHIHWQNFMGTIRSLKGRN